MAGPNKGGVFAVVPLRCGHSLRLSPPPHRRDKFAYYCPMCQDYRFRADRPEPEWWSICRTHGCPFSRTHGQSQELAEHAANMHSWKTSHTVVVEYLEGRSHGRSTRRAV